MSVHKTTVEIAQKYLYEDIDKVPDWYKDKMMRMRTGFTFWYEFPTKTRKEVREHLVNLYGVSNVQAYDDILVIEQLLGSIKNPSKEWMRYRVNSMLEQAFALAERQNDPKAMALVADKIGKYNQLDQVDPEKIPFDQIVPQPFEPTEDPTVLGIQRDPDIREKKQKMLEKYSSEIEIVDVPYTEVNGDDDQEEGLL